MSDEPNESKSDEDNASWWARVLADPANQPDPAMTGKWWEHPDVIALCELIADALTGTQRPEGINGDDSPRTRKTTQQGS
jgi:hypothetical protein